MGQIQTHLKRGQNRIDIKVKISLEKGSRDARNGVGKVKSNGVAFVNIVNMINIIRDEC